ncbi:hypothetical protein RXV86_21085 [Alisedimentitalea sp. MJ-SS2]|uniref:hypothetical protein n=1 Tax=Aliisedimentitalea sp. MJ-SS2 TaxID=3049795 RepID=UPI002905FBD9|nr:hypothetical protein [Alisedimentitalea sp. MJ-SS2]MDU8929889.1 hypothetical protein [Alisedimentitalea sp. MJ-SS2]
MTESADITKLQSDLKTRLDQKLGLKRGSLEKRMKKAGRRLPRRVHRDAAAIGEAAALAEHPKLRRRVDAAGIKAAHHRISEHLSRIDPREQRIRFWLGVLAGLAFNVLAVATLVIVVLKWRGFL